ncbi:acyltransferase family protein [Corynebacterium frankenforstense]|uniref:acyltransferase family protein n=1 Tax=Corynebacterium frankenforstense TaxID=1230998 RepID=UPI0009512F5F|nr:acyltransferase family protein [Corynebacterium frankenforstense]
MPATAASSISDAPAAPSVPASPSAVAPARRRGLIPRLPALDGLRGVAVVAVVLYHFFGDALPGGYLGVDVFFVLSGFLITSLLVRERTGTGRINLKRFWLKRARRILPAAVFVATVTAVVAGFVGGDRTVGLDRQYLSSLFFFNNWAQIIASKSYFASGGAEIFAHYWSLSVEEQFYLVWPLVILAVVALAGARRLRAAAIGCVVAALASAAWMATLFDPAEDPSRVYYGTDTHAFGLLFGAAAALWLCSQERGGLIWRRRAGNWPLAAAAVVIVGMVALPDSSPVAYRGGIVAVSAATALLIVGLAGRQPLLTTVLANPVLRRLGAVSFSLYLWHWPVVVITDELLPDWATRTGVGIIALPISYLLAEITFTYVEEPLRRRGYRAVFGPRVRSTAIAALVAVVAVTTALVKAPDQTGLEADLQAAAQRQAENAQPARPVPADDGDAATADAGSKVAPDKRRMPAGDRMTAVGDSVMLASMDALQTEFPGIYVDGAVSRHWMDAPGILDDLDAQGALGDVVVLGFGTNGPSDGAGDEQLLDRVLDRLGEDRTVVLVLPYGDRWYMPDAESEVREEADRRPNVFVADWCHAAKADQSKLREDLVHPTPEGASAYAHAVRTALEHWRAGDRTVPGVCGV